VIGVRHTAPAHVQTFEGLLRAADPGLQSRRTVDVALFDDARVAEVAASRRMPMLSRPRRGVAVAERASRSLPCPISV